MVCPSCLDTNIACHICAKGFVEPLGVPLPQTTGRDLRLFGSDAYPLRASALQNLVQCPWRVVMEYLFGRLDESGPAADTGSATHAAIAAWHELGQNAPGAVEEMVRRGGEYPLADLDEAAQLFLLYSRDPRNVNAEFPVTDARPFVEQQISFTIPACKEDPTKAPLVVIGTVDQVRRVSGKLRVFDVKTSKRPGRDLMNEHVYQVAAYCLGASAVFGEPVHPGALICPRGYGRQTPESSPPGVFFDFPWTFEDCRFVLWGVRRVVAAVRSGEVWHMGGQHCRWCQAASPDNCIPLLRSVTDPRTMEINATRCRTNALAPSPAWNNESTLDFGEIS